MKINKLYTVCTMPDGMSGMGDAMNYVVLILNP